MSLAEAVDRLMNNAQVLVGVDFDGTLAPIVDRPDLAVPDERALDLLRRLAGEPGVAVAIVSGRGLDDLRERVGDIHGVTFIGEHGNDIEGDPVEPSPELIEAEALVGSLHERYPAATVEKKQRSVTFHTRALGPGDTATVRDDIHQWIRGREGIDLIEGKEVFELTTATRSKGDAIRELAGDAPVIYIGDDTTDETVFEALGPGDIGVKVGDGPTAATHRVEDIGGVVAILEQIVLASG